MPFGLFRRSLARELRTCGTLPVHTNEGVIDLSPATGNRRNVPLWLKAVAIAIGYVALAELGNLLSVQSTFATFWPPAGLLVAVLLISDRREWPALILAGLLGNIASDLLHGRALLAIAGFGLANIVEAVTGATLVAVLVARKVRLDSLRQVMAFAAVAAVLAPVVGATLGTLVVSATTPGANWWTVWYTWWIGDALGIVLVGSVILSVSGAWKDLRQGHGARVARLRRSIVQAVLVALPFAVLAFFDFAPAGGGTSWKFLVTPGLITCGIVGGPVGAALGLLIIALGGVGGMVFGAPIESVASAVAATHVLQAQAFFLVGGIATLALAGVISEDRVHAREARHAAERFRLLFDTMREGVAYCRMVLQDGRPVDWVFLQVNEAFTTITGLDDVVGRHAWELLPGADATNPEMLANFGRTAATGEPTMFDTPGSSGTTWRLSVTSPARGDFLAVFEDVTERVAEERALAESNRRLEKMVHDVAEAMGSVVEARDAYTQGHQVRVAGLALKIAREMGLSETTFDEISLAGLLHDIGKLRVPAEILTKPGTLSTAEMSLIREHPAQGYEILRHIDFPWPVAEIVRQHHERSDGSGYPTGLRGDEIMLSARILAVADVIEAMASHRPYRPALGLEKAFEEIGSYPERYDSDVLAASRRLYERGETGL